MSRTSSSGRGADPESVERLFDLAGFVPKSSNDGFRRDSLERLCASDPPVVRREGERRALRLIDAAWNAGWQPAEAVRQVRRTADALTVALALVAIAADHADRDASTLDPRWTVQLDELDLPNVAAADGWFAEWGNATRRPWPDQVESVVTLLRSFTQMSRIETLIPPPGAQAGPARLVDLASKTDDPMLKRVRALLALAESTNFEAEAEAFTAKAQELMTRHAIDMAMVSATAPRADQPTAIRIPIDEPYVNAKSTLLQFVADSSRCRAVFHQRFAMSTVVGFADDIVATETLFTSLLVQAQIAMRAASTSAAPGTRARSRLFRSSFLTAYAYRVDERLTEINAYVVARAEAETGRSIVPVLAARSSAVDASVGEMFPRLRTTSSRRGLDPAGWASGRMAADRAQLNAADLGSANRALPGPEPRTATR